MDDNDEDIPSNTLEEWIRVADNLSSKILNDTIVIENELIFKLDKALGHTSTQFRNIQGVLDSANDGNEFLINDYICAGY